MHRWLTHALTQTRLSILNVVWTQQKKKLLIKRDRMSGFSVVSKAWALLALVSSVAATASTSDRANIVLIITDDQDIVLNAQLDAPLGPMAKTKALLQDAGAFGVAAYVNVRTHMLCSESALCVTRTNL